MMETQILEVIEEELRKLREILPAFETDDHAAYWQANMDVQVIAEKIHDLLVDLRAAAGTKITAVHTNDTRSLLDLVLPYQPLSEGWALSCNRLVLPFCGVTIVKDEHVFTSGDSFLTIDLRFIERFEIETGTGF